MKLSRMEDVGGVRAVLPSQEAAYGIAQSLKRNWTITRFRDYVSHPKPDGYRALHLVNRNRGSGTRVLIDALLKGRRPPGHAVEPRSHNAVAASIAQGRADWGVAIDTVVRHYRLEFIPLRAERYDFAIPESRWDRAAVVAFREILADPVHRGRLGELGFLIEGGRP